MPVSRGRVGLLLLSVACLALFVGLAAWQVERRACKHALIAQVDARIHAEPVEAPGPDHRPTTQDAYRRVQATGRFIAGRDTFVRAATDLGSGYWVMTPLRRPDGTIVLINRGFVSGDDRSRIADVTTEPATAPATGLATITGLLRLSEHGRGFLSHDDPATDRWVTRDVDAIAKARGLQRVAPYFIDADAGPVEAPPRTRPVGGLTVVAFSDNHLLYAIVWSVLALVCLVAVVRVIRHPPA